MTNTYSYFLKGCCLVAVLFMTIPLMGQTGKDSRIFKTRRQTNLTRSIYAQLTHSDTIPLQNMSAVYAFSIDATITQPREASFVRIVLEDAEGHDYLVAESDRFRNDTATVQLTEYCEETARLDGITPVRLKCYLAGDATLTVTGIHTSDQMPTRGETNSMETAAAIKEAQVQDIVDRINEYNARHGKLWRAGLNNWALADYDSDIKGEGDAYTANFKYYTDGIYEMGERPAQRTTYVSPYVEAFDWRDRHGKNWVGDSIRNQQIEGPCSSFAAVGVVEAMTNLFFNQIINLDLSEKFVTTYSGWDSGQISLMYEPLWFIKRDSVIDEESLPYTTYVNLSNPMPTPRPTGLESISFSDTLSVLRGSLSIDELNDSIKHHIINYGPGVCGFGLSSGYSHIMTLVGYFTADSINYYTNVNHNGQSTSFTNYPGQTCWIFKDSWGHTKDSIYKHNGYRYMICSKDYLKPAYFIKTPIFSRNYHESDIICEDEDGDGFFNWGISPICPVDLPEWAEAMKDGDDSDPLKGGISLYGLIDNIYYDEQPYVINSSITDDILSNWYQTRFIRDSVIINSGNTLTINNYLAFHLEKTITIQSGAKLIIHGGRLYNPTIIAQPGSAIIIENGGHIIYDRKKPDFTIPLGVKLQITNGSIDF